MHLTRIIARSLPLGVVVVKPASCYLKQDLTVVTYINATHDHAGTYCMYGTKPDDLRTISLDPTGRPAAIPLTKTSPNVVEEPILVTLKCDIHIF